MGWILATKKSKITKDKVLYKSKYENKFETMKSHWSKGNKENKFDHYIMYLSKQKNTWACRMNIMKAKIWNKTLAYLKNIFWMFAFDNCYF